MIALAFDNFIINIMFCIVPVAISSEVMDQTEDEGSIASFTCQATGEPIPTVSWYFSDASITNETNMNKYDILQSSVNATTLSNTLKIMNVQSSDVGTYTCNATNVVSSDTSSGVLTVNGELIIVGVFESLYTYAFLTVAPRFTILMEGQQFNITEGSNGSITCTATGYPVPTVVWQNSDGSSFSNNRLISGSPVNISSTGVGNVSSVSVELMVIGAMRVDSGMYRCSASNAVSSTVKSFGIIVQCTYVG